MTSRQLRDDSKNSFRNGEAMLKDWETLGLFNQNLYEISLVIMIL